MRTRLNGTGTGGGADLEIHGAELADIQAGADELADDLDASGHLAENHTHVTGILLRTAGFESGPALIDVATRWQSQTDALRDACLRVSGHLRETTRSHAAAEQEAAAAVREAGAVLNPRLTGAV
ncbi:hypothetical protein [Streptomyces millisiae]|uniref:ESX-1 secretion-associated protein n=1 Tax=Streptomyces millisiae TaxID=3075542 RepID=A0ABU2LTW4_9ACTN|nr:hypothetical protein [Streptomyces sp. DSM 44918]MDT0321038.1 hypothetical protein [Streptomyces sp. DSM 44918]